MNRRNFLKTLAAVALGAKGLEALADERKEDNKPKIVVLDAGHGLNNREAGKNDPGCVYGGQEEANLVLDYAAKARDILTQNGVDVRLTRASKTEGMHLYDRSKFANGTKAGLYVSVHCNATPGHDSRGPVVYHYPKSKGGIPAAEKIHAGLVGKLKEKATGFVENSLGVRADDAKRYHVLRRTTMPAVIVETGFLDNDKDRTYLTANVDTIGEAIAKGVLDYFGIKPKEKAKP